MAITTVACSGGSDDDEPGAARMIELGHGWDTGWDTQVSSSGMSETDHAGSSSSTTGDGTWTGEGSAGGGTYGTGAGEAGDGGDGDTGIGGTGNDGGGDGDGGDETGGTCSAEVHELNAFVEGEDHWVAHLAEGGGDDGKPPANYPPGWLGRFDLVTSTQCNFQNWKDTDGVAPETAGCHHAYEDAKCTTQTNDVFGEYCEDDDVLVESNPGAGVCHSHKIGANGVGVGRPDRFSCSVYCYQSYAVWGNCAATQNTCGNGVYSARCECWL